MPSFRFLHAADLHLDSPLIGLSRKSASYAARIDDASRRAFDNLIDLAKAQACRFVVIAGDVFDGQWRNYQTGLFFAERMRRLREANIRVIMILGNHDAENRFASRLQLADNVTILSAARASSYTLEDLDTVIHGRSFPARDVTENLALSYPAPAAGRFNIGLLHTACSGAEDGHAVYAPCTVEQLVNHRYDYWALGHVHTTKILSTDPYVVYPGNLQGRHARESGPKGAVIVSVEEGRVRQVEHHSLDVIRWSVEDLDASELTDVSALYGVVRDRLEHAVRAADGRGVALRLCISGQTPLHSALVADRSGLREELETIAMHVSPELWIEKIELRTQTPRQAESTDPTIAGQIRIAIERLSEGEELAAWLEEELSIIKAKMPATAHIDELFASLRAEGPKRAVDLALSLVAQGQ